MDDEVNAITGTFGSLNFNLLDNIVLKLRDWAVTPTRVPPDIRVRFLRACIIVLEDGVKRASDGPIVGRTSVLHECYIVKRGLASPSDLRFGVHRLDRSQMYLPNKHADALKPLAAMLRHDFEVLGVARGL